MSSQSLSHLPGPSIHQTYDSASNSGRPVTLPGFAKLVLIVGAFLIFAPMWMHLASQLAAGQSWYALRLVALAATAGGVTLLVLGFKVSAALLKATK